MGEARALGKGKHISTGEGLGFVEVGHDYVTYKYYPDTSLFFFISLHPSNLLRITYLPVCRCFLVSDPWTKGRLSNPWIVNRSVRTEGGGGFANKYIYPEW